MSEASNGLANPQTVSNEMSWKLGPRDFLLKNLKYIPWIIICGALALVLAYLKIRYSTPIYFVQSSMLINNTGSGGGKEDRFDALMMTPGTENLRDRKSVV